MKRLKKIIAWWIKQIFKLIPLPLSIKVVHNSPKLARCLSDKHEFIYPKYLGDISIAVNTIYPIERELVSSIYDKETSWVIKRIVRANEVCLDVGANIGAISFVLAKQVQPNGQVFAFEPNKVIYDRLTNNINLNKKYQDIIKPINLGLSDQEGSLLWREDENNLGNGGCLNIEQNWGKEIKVTTIDYFLVKHTINRIDFIKIDVEGMELEVIKGAQQSLISFKPTIYYESRKEFEEIRNRPVLQEIEQLLLSIGYNLYQISKDQLQIVRYPRLSYNIIAIHQDKLNKIEQNLVCQKKH